jgi:hypothetical protein
MKLNTHRQSILVKWTKNAASPNVRAHISCLEKVGLALVPLRAHERAEFETKVSQTISDDVSQMIANMPRVGDLLEMCDRAWAGVKEKFTVHNPTNESVEIMQSLVRYHVTKNMSIDRELQPNASMCQTISDGNAIALDVSNAIANGVDREWLHDYADCAERVEAAREKVERERFLAAERMIEVKRREK